MASSPATTSTSTGTAITAPVAATGDVVAMPATFDAVGPALIPAALRIWFLVQGALDAASAIPLLLFPAWALGLLGWTTIDPVASRLCGAALLGIGTASLMVRRHGLAGCRALMGLNLVWSLAAVFGLLAAIGVGAPPAAWAFLSIFIVFAGVWFSFAIRLRQLARADQLDDPVGNGADADADATPTRWRAR